MLLLDYVLYLCSDKLDYVLDKCYIMFNIYISIATVYVLFLPDQQKESDCSYGVGVSRCRVNIDTLLLQQLFFLS